MAGVLVWSPEAIEDIESIAAYIERDSPWYAKAVVSKQIDESIPEYPQLGRIVPELADSSIRETPRPSISPDLPARGESRTDSGDYSRSARLSD